MITLRQIMLSNKTWFNPGNVESSGDLWYEIMESKSGVTYLVRKTNAWTDMFDGVKKPHYRLNPIASETLKIGLLTPEKFRDMEEVEEWLTEN